MPKPDAPIQLMTPAMKYAPSGNTIANSHTVAAAENIRVVRPLTANRIAAGSAGFSAQTQADTRLAPNPTSSDTHNPGDTPKGERQSLISPVHPAAGCSAQIAIPPVTATTSRAGTTKRTSGVFKSCSVMPACFPVLTSCI